MQRKAFHESRLLISLSAVVLCAAMAVAQNTTPAWWAERGVLTTNAAHDYAALNVGQLKHLAYSAWLELDALPGGAGFVPTFTNGLNNFAAVNMGQLKATAAPFYDRLGLTNHYPWTGSTNTDDFSIVNNGQAKFLFSFDPQHIGDLDQDGMPDEWEIAHGVNVFDDTDASLDTDGDGLSNLDEFLLNSSPTNPDFEIPSGTAASAQVFGAGATGLLILTPNAAGK